MRLPFYKVYVFITLLCCILFQACSEKKGITITGNNYPIIISANADSVTENSARVLADYIFRISGERLEIIAGSRKTNTPAIFLGRGEHTSSFADEETFKGLGSDGFLIKTINQDLQIAGNTPEGTRNAVYAFLEDYLDCRMYTPDVMYVPEMKTIELPTIHDRQVPVFTFRELNYQWPMTSLEYRQWHKLDKKTDPGAAWGHLWVHTFDDLVPAEKYFEQHPEYFTEIDGDRIPGGQLCLSNPEVLEVLTANLQRVMDSLPEKTFWSVSQNDNYLVCQCEECKKLDKLYGGPSGTLIHFVNNVARRFPDKVISTLAYQYTRTAPENIIPDENVNIMLCSIECDRSKPISEEKGGNTFLKDLQDWGKLTDNIMIWDYVVQFRNLLSPFPNFHVLQPNLQLFADNNAFMMFQQGCGNNVGEFSDLRTYIIARLLWDPGRDVQEIIRDFTDGYYGKAAPYIREYIQKMHTALLRSGKVLYIYGYPYDAIDGYLSPLLIREYSGLFDKAEEAVLDDPELLQRVKTARLPLEYAMLEISMRNVDEELSFFLETEEGWKPNPEMKEKLEKFTNQAKLSGVTRYEEGGKYPDEYYKAMLHYVENSMKNPLGLGKPVTLLTEHSENYPVGGAKALTDGLIGTLDFHFNWLGFHGEDMEAIIDLGEIQTISLVRASFLQEVKSWIFLPQEVSLYVSPDNQNWVFLQCLNKRAPENQDDIFTEEFSFQTGQAEARYIRINARSMKKCPSWHIGAGGKSWIFCDEVIIE